MKKTTSDKGFGIRESQILSKVALVFSALQVLAARKEYDETLADESPQGLVASFGCSYPITGLSTSPNKFKNFVKGLMRVKKSCVLKPM